MGYVKKVEAARNRQLKSFRARVEAKYKIMEVVKKAATKALKTALPTLVMFSSATGLAKIKNPDALGKKFQEIATEVSTKASVKTHILQNDKDQPQIIVYTVRLPYMDVDETATIKYIEGKGATVRYPQTASDGSGLQTLAEEFKTILTSLDTYVKNNAKTNQIAVNTK